MRLHILGICGTFMGGLALIARALGHQVSGSDSHVYPPMSTLLAEQGIEIIEGYDSQQLADKPDMVIIGNAMKRGNPCVEYVLEHAIPYTSGPQWLHDHLLQYRSVIAVAGTHGKTTTASMVTWILQQAGYQPSFLIGGRPGNFAVSAQLTDSQYFVIEADEYDTAFFDKRSKFVHYCPQVVIVNNLEFDHADIFDNLAAIQKQFHHLIRLVPASGTVISAQQDQNVQTMLAMGCWSHQQQIADDQWHVKPLNPACSQFTVYYQQQSVGQVNWSLIGEHNMHNGLMAIIAAHSVGISAEQACQALASFISPARRLELRGMIKQIAVYDDFAHHPTAIAVTLQAMRSKMGSQGRILAVLEPRSNTLKMGINNQPLATALGLADQVFLFQPANISWSVADIAQQCQTPCYIDQDIDSLVAQIVKHAQPNDAIVVMSNGSFANIQQKLLTQLTAD